MKIQWLKLIISIIICQVPGIIGSQFTVKSIPTWYAALNKPAFNPPNWLFGPVWITLYILMGISLYLVWSKSNIADINNLLIIFFIQLFLNALWSVIFFGFKSLGFAFVEIMILWLFILITIILFYSVSKTASVLLIPYLLWVLFASLLNYYIWKLN